MGYGFGNLTNNRYAAAMRGFAENSSLLSGLLLLCFYIYQVFCHEQARFFSLRTVGLVVGGAILFAAIAKKV
jgi:hypothetical protein